MHQVRLVYYSESRLAEADGSLLANLAHLQRVSARNNARLGLTGALAFDDLWFLQVLEGERSAVWATFLRILDDTGHDAAVLVSCVPIEHRIFGAWAMRLAAPAAASDQRLAPFKVDGRLRPDLMSGDEIVTALGALVLDRPRAPRAGRASHEQPGADVVPWPAAITP